MFTLNTATFPNLEAQFLTHLLAVKKQEPLGQVLVVSPSGKQLNRLQQLLAEQKPGFLNVHFLTFYALAERILAEGPVAEDHVVTEPALFREIIQSFLENKGDIPFTSRRTLLREGVAIPKGLSAALAATLRDLQDSGARVVDCANVAREGHMGEATGGSVPILELNVLMYDVLRKHGLRTGADFIRRAAERAAKSEWIKNQKAILLYGFYDLTGVQLDLVNALSAHPNTHVYFPYEENNTAYGYAEILLKDPGFTSKTKSEKRKAMSENVDVTLFAPRSSLLDVQAWSCSGTHDEVWLTAKKILELAGAGVPFHAMAVQGRMLEPYLNTLREVFDTHHIPYALHAEEPVGAFPLVKAVRQVLSGASSDAGRATSWSEHVAWAQDLLTHSIVLPMDASEIEQRLWDGIAGAIDSLAQLDALNKPVSRERFLEVVEEKLEALRLPLASDNTAGVQIMDVMTARGLSFEAVFLIGLNEKLFPRLIREDPFLSDEARSALAQALGCRLGRKMDGYQEEKLLFDLAINSARSHLHLSCQRSDEEGKALVVSLYLHDFLRKNQLSLQSLRRTWVEKIRQVPTATLTPKEISLAMHRADRDTDILYGELRWDRDLIAHLLKTQREIEAFGALGAHDAMIGKDHGLAKKLLSEGLSPATLKDLAECPFKVYARKILELDPDDAEVTDGEASHLARGKMVHEILEQFYRGFKGGEWEARLEKEAKSVFEKFGKDHAELYPLAWEAEQNRLLAMLKRFLPLDLAEMQKSGFKPEYFEIELGTTDPMVLHGRIDRLDLRTGDRPGFRVVDYKTGSGGIGKKDKVETAIMKGKNFQLPIYLMLAQAWLQNQGNPSAKEGTATFYRLEQGDSLEIGQDFWDEHGPRFYDNLSLMVKTVEAGSFYIRPTDIHGYCSWCAYAALCRKEHKPTQIRSENSPLRKKHEEAFRP